MNKKGDFPKRSHSSKNKDERNHPDMLPGWPGYRTREGRSGYDPIDTRIEAAHTFSAFVHHLFTGQLKIKNPIFLFSSGILGLVLMLPFLLAISELINENNFSWDAWLTLLVAGIIGLALLINFIKNLARMYYK